VTMTVTVTMTMTVTVTLTAMPYSLGLLLGQLVLPREKVHN